MKNKLNRTFKFGILFLGMTLLFWNCEKSEEITNKEIQQEKNRTEISFEQFKSNISSKEKLQTFNRFFDINKSSSKTTFNKKNTNDFNDATILTDNIIKIKKNNFTSYTFTILTQTEDFEFYNLVLYVNNNQEIYKSHILKYTPSEKWLADTTQHFSGNVKIINNDFFNVDNLLQSKSSTHAKSLANDDCIDSVTTEWVCGAGNNHEPGHPDCRPENNAVTEYVITIEYRPCTDNGGGNGDFDPETGSEGGSTSGGGDGGIVTAPNTVPYTSQLKQFQSGTLNSVERTYYSSNSNIKNNIDRYLIQKSFSSIAKFDAKLALEFSESLNLNFQQFNWVFNNRDSQDLNDIKDYLNEAINITSEIEDFVKKAIDALNDDGEIDLEDKVIVDSTVVKNQKVKCVYDKLKSLSNNVFSDIINEHFDSAKKSHVRFRITTTPNGEDAFTRGFTNNGISFFEIQLDPTVVSNASTIEIALMLVHESIHAELLDRCVQLGIINAFDSKGRPNFTNTSITYNTKDELFAKLVYQYKNYNGGNSQWNHDLFTVTDYRAKMALNLVNIHSKLNDTNNDFLTNVNNDSQNVYGNFTLQQLMEYISWVGLEGTQEYINNIQNNATEKANKNYVENAARNKYTNTCN